MNIKYSSGKSEFGPGIDIALTGDEVARAICTYIVAHGVYIGGARTIRVNGELCKSGKIYVDPSGFVITPEGEKMLGSGEKKKQETPDLTSNVLGELKKIDEASDYAKWQWKMDYCRKKGLAPAQNEIWDLAEVAWKEAHSEEKKPEEKAEVWVTLTTPEGPIYFVKDEATVCTEVNIKGANKTTIRTQVWVKGQPDPFNVLEPVNEVMLKLKP